MLKIDSETKQAITLVVSVSVFATIVYFLSKPNQNVSNADAFDSIVNVADTASSAITSNEPTIEYEYSHKYEYSPSGYLVVPYPLCDDMLSAFHYANAILGEKAENNYFIWRGGMFRADTLHLN